MFLKSLFKYNEVNAQRIKFSSLKGRYGRFIAEIYIKGKDKK